MIERLDILGPWSSRITSQRAWMTHRDAEHVGYLILKQAELVAPRPLQVLEWGSGLSTISFSDDLTRASIQYSWFSIEYDRDYYLKYMAHQIQDRNGSTIYVNGALSPAQVQQLREAQSGLHCTVFDSGPLLPQRGHMQDRMANLDQYVSFPSVLRRNFDVIIVDGRKRRRCLQSSIALLAFQGFVVLHDALRPYYHCAMPKFRHSTFVADDLWLGSNDPVKIIDDLPESSFRRW